MLDNNTSFFPYQDEPQGSPSFSRNESWENYIQFSSEQAPTFSDEYSEMQFEKPQDLPEPMEEEFTMPTYSEYQNSRLFDEQNDMDILSSHPNFNQGEQIQPDQRFEDERSECCHSEEQEDIGSISTKDTIFEDFASTFDGEAESMASHEDIVINRSFYFENEVKDRINRFLSTRPEEEKFYIHKVMPMLIASLKEQYVQFQAPVTEEVIISILKELLYGKELMIGAERKVLKEMVGDEMSQMRSVRPEGMVTEDDLSIQKRKEKIAHKGNRNLSGANHMNENYVSNIFQFAKRNYPEDKDIQRLGNERNVSASNFRNLMRANLSDDFMLRKAKARIMGSGKELLGNIEYWMKDGYFEQCADREKYILRREKALRDLALTGIN